MLRRVLIGAVRFYQRAVSPFTPATCRYEPTCSEYACQALETHGALRGSGLALRRFLRCHPWGGHGYDPVPPARAAGAHAPDGSSHDEPTPNGTPAGPVISDR